MTGRLSADERYRWVALANTTAAMFMAALDGSIVIIALPAIFHGIHLDPLAAGTLLAVLAGAASLLRGRPVRADRPADREGHQPSARLARP